MRVKILISLLLIVCGTLCISAQSSPGIQSARMHALAGSGMTLEGIDAAYANPAGLAWHRTTMLHAGSAQSFGLAPLTQGNAAAALQVTKAGLLFATAGQFGFAAFQEREISVGYAMQLGEGLTAAARFDVTQLTIEGYGNAMLPGFLLGMQYRIGNTWRVGAAVRNPVQIATHTEITLPVLLSIGASYHPSEEVSVYGEMTKDIDFPVRMRLAVEYRIIDALILRVGMAGNPGTFHAGVGIGVRKSLRIDLGAGYHAQLGMTPSIGVVYTTVPARS